MRILLAEDEIAMSEALVDILSFHNYSVDAVYDGAAALDYARAQSYDGIILDIMMPRMNGIEVLEQLRRDGNFTPVLLLTAKGEVEDRIRGLDAGADDYLPKPFAMAELLARLRAMLRRRENYVSVMLRLGNVSLDPRRFELCCGEKVQSLSKLEYQIMELLMRNPGMTFPAETLLERVWGCNSDAGVGAVWVYISYLRKKLSTLGADVLIASRRGLGYTLEVRR